MRRLGKEVTAGASLPCTFPLPLSFPCPLLGESSQSPGEQVGIGVGASQSLTQAEARGRNITAKSQAQETKMGK